VRNDSVVSHNKLGEITPVVPPNGAKFFFRGT